MRNKFITIIFILISKFGFGQKLLWQSIDKKQKFKYEYCFVLSENSPWIADQKNPDKVLADDTIYQINAKKKLSLEELNVIMNCVKNSVDQNGNIDCSKCSDYKKYIISFQI